MTIRQLMFAFNDLHHVGRTDDGRTLAYRWLVFRDCARAPAQRGAVELSRDRLRWKRSM